MRVGVYVHHHAVVKAQVCPGFLKDMRQRQEAYACVAVGEHGEPLVVYAQGGVEIAVSEHRAFGLSGGAGGVYKCGKVVLADSRCACCYFGSVFGGGTASLLQEVHKRYRTGFGTGYALAVNTVYGDNQPQRWAFGRKCAYQRIFLRVAGEYRGGSAVVYDELDLLGRGRGIYGYGDYAVGVGAEVCGKHGGRIGRQQRHFVAGFKAGGGQGVGHGGDLFVEFVPRDWFGGGICVRIVIDGYA